MDLHASVGPAQTTVSMVAERAGVQRHTFYAHFPDDRSLLLACSAYHLERAPMPDAEPWRQIADRSERLKTGLLAIYGWYEDNAALLSSVLRDAQNHPLTQEISAMRFGPIVATYHEVLGAKLNVPQQAMLHLALSFFTWRSLVQESGLKPAAAVKAMVHAIDSANEV
jgi:AcrR family transcriptional regulator